MRRYRLEWWGFLLGQAVFRCRVFMARPCNAERQAESMARATAFPGREICRHFGLSGGHLGRGLVVSIRVFW